MKPTLNPWRDLFFMTVGWLIGLLSVLLASVYTAAR